MAQGSMLSKEDVVFRKHRGHIQLGLVTYSYTGDSTSESEDSEDDEDCRPVRKGEARIAWYPKGHEEVIAENKITVHDRSLLPGDIVKYNSESQSQKGIIKSIRVMCHSQICSTKQMVYDIPSQELKPIGVFQPSDHVVYGNWVGVLRDVHPTIITVFKNGAKAALTEDDACKLVDVHDNSNENSVFGEDVGFFPGQTLHGPAAAFRSAKWLSGPKPIMGNKARFRVVVEQVKDGEVEIQWRTRSVCKDEGDLKPPPLVLKGKDLDKLKPLNFSAHANVQLGDKFLYTLREEDLGYPEPVQKGSIASFRNPDKRHVSGATWDLQLSENTSKGEIAKSNESGLVKTENKGASLVARLPEDVASPSLSASATQEAVVGMNTMNSESDDNDQGEATCLDLNPIKPRPFIADSELMQSSGETSADMSNGSVEQGTEKLETDQLLGAVGGNESSQQKLAESVEKNFESAGAAKPELDQFTKQSQEINGKEVSMNEQISESLKKDEDLSKILSLLQNALGNDTDKRKDVPYHVARYKDMQSFIREMTNAINSGNPQVSSLGKEIKKMLNTLPKSIGVQQLHLGRDSSDAPSIQKVQELQSDLIALRNDILCKAPGGRSYRRTWALLERDIEGYINKLEGLIANGSSENGELDHDGNEKMELGDEAELSEEEEMDEGNEDDEELEGEEEVEVKMEEDNDGVTMEEDDGGKDKIEEESKDGARPKVPKDGSKKQEGGGRKPARHKMAKKKKEPVKAEPVKAGQEVCVEVTHTETRVDVQWQDGSMAKDLLSTDVIPCRQLDDLEFFIGDFVMPGKETTPEFGVVTKSNNKERTCCINWISRNAAKDTTAPIVESDEQSVYELSPHLDLVYGVDDLVVRIALTKEENQSGVDLPPAGQVLHINTNGTVAVRWVDDTITNAWPYHLMKIEEDFDSEFSFDGNYGDDGNHDNSDGAIDGSDVSSDGSWETASEDGEEERDCDMVEGEAPIDSSAKADQKAEPEKSEEAAETTTSQDITDASPPQTTKEDEELMVNKSAGEMDLLQSPVFYDELQSPNAASRFIMESCLPTCHHYSSTQQPTNTKQFMSVYRKEIRLLQTALPKGILVKAFEDRMDLFSAMIEGPVNTPYEDGVFFFDIRLPGEYPKSPPLVYYLSFCSGRLNPNLYSGGKVCLSLLGTWSGKGNEMWTSSSNLMQLLVSIQGLILVNEPYYNEAGYEKHRGTKESLENCRLYNEMVLVKLVQAMTKLVQSPPEIYKEESMRFCERHAGRLIKRLESWIKTGAKENNVCATSSTSTSTAEHSSDMAGDGLSSGGAEAVSSSSSSSPWQSLTGHPSSLPSPPMESSEIQSHSQYSSAEPFPNKDVLSSDLATDKTNSEKAAPNSSTENGLPADHASLLHDTKEKNALLNPALNVQNLGSNVPNSGSNAPTTASNSVSISDSDSRTSHHHNLPPLPINQSRSSAMPVTVKVAAPPSVGAPSQPPYSLFPLSRGFILSLQKALDKFKLVLHNSGIS